MYMYVCIHMYYIKIYMKKLIKVPFCLINMEEYIHLKWQRTETDSKEWFFKVYSCRKTLRRL